MKTIQMRVATLLVLVLIVVPLAGCAGNAAEAPTDVAQATSTPEPLPTLKPVPTPIPTPIPPTPSPSPTPTLSDAAALLKEVQGTQQQVKSARGLMEIDIVGREAGKEQSATMAIEFEINEPDAHMRMSMVGEDLPMKLDMEFIAKDKVTYIKMGDEWMAFEGGDSEIKSEMNMADVSELEAYLEDASGLEVIGRRVVNGVECDIIGFTISSEKMLELARLSGRASSQRALEEEVEISEFQGEVAIGVADKMMREMVLDMSGRAKDNPQDGFSMHLTMSMWDINSPDITIEAPEGVEPMAFPTPSGDEN